MRQYKFRGKRKDNWQWVYGSYTHCYDVDGNPSIIPFNDNRFISVIPETVGQFTNKLDSELMDVFEGDIVQGDNGKMWEVIYSLRVSGWIISNKRIKDTGRNKFAGDEEYSFDRYRQLCKSAKTDTFKKIGNVFDNPELLIPPADSPAFNTMNIYDPKEGQKEEVKAPATETEQEQVPGEETEG